MLGLGFLQPPQVAQDEGEVAAADQGVGVLGAQDAGADLQDGAVLGLGFLQPPPVAQHGGKVAAARRRRERPGRAALKDVQKVFTGTKRVSTGGT